jgi:hypothetical protein
MDALDRRHLLPRILQERLAAIFRPADVRQLLAPGEGLGQRNERFLDPRAGRLLGLSAGAQPSSLPEVPSVSEEPPRLALSRVAPGLALLWAAGPPPEGDHPIALRRQALYAGSAALPTRRPFAGAEPLREVTLLDGGRLTPAALQGVLRRVWRAAGNPLVRLELSAPELAALRPTPDQVEGWRSPGALQVQVLFERLELSAPLPALLERLADGGLPLAGEIYLERGVTDALELLRAFLLKLLRHRCRPYYLVDGAWLAPARRVAEKEGLKLIEGLRGWVSGLAVPQLVYENEQGARTPRIPAYLRRLDEDGATVTGFRGTTHRYAHLPPDSE